MPNRPVSEAPSVEVRKRLAEHLAAAREQGAIVYLTSHGRRVAALVPVPVADEAIERDGQQGR